MLWFISNSFAATAVDQERPCAEDLLVQVELVCGAVTINGSDRKTVRISGEVDEPDALEVSATPGRVSVVVKSSGFFGKTPCATLVIDVPRNAALHAEAVSASVTAKGLVRTVQASTVSGRVRVEGSPLAVNLSSVSGSVEVVGATRRVDAETVSGGVSLQEVFGHVQAESVSGKVDIQGGIFDRLVVESMSGSITARGTPGAAAVWQLESFSGKVDLSLPMGSDAVVSWETLSGGVDVLGDRRKEGDRTLGAGNARIGVESFSGSVRVAQN